MNLTELEYQIVHYNAQYRAGFPEISDEQYDKLIDRLKEEQPNSTPNLQRMARDGTQRRSVLRICRNL